MRRRPLLLLPLALPGVARAQGSFPSRPVRLVVPVPPGGSVDALARILARGMTEHLGQPVVVENHGGAGGNIAFEMVANARPDGHTVLAGWDSVAINPAVYRNLGWDPLRSFAPVLQTVRAAQIIAVRPDLPPHDLAGLVALARTRPVTVGTPGNGSIGHLTLELLRTRLPGDVVLTHVPYRGGGPAITDLLAGSIDALSLTLAAVTQHVRAGRVRGIGVSTAARAPALPDVPTLAEQGVAGFDVVSWQGLLVPAGTEATVMARLNAAANRVLATQEVAQQLSGQGLDPVGGGPEVLATLLAADVARWPAVVRAAGVSVD